TSIYHHLSFRLSFFYHSFMFSVCYYLFVYHRDLHSFPTRRSSDLLAAGPVWFLNALHGISPVTQIHVGDEVLAPPRHPRENEWRSEEHTSELQSRFDLVCRLLLEKKKKIITIL